MKNLHAKSPCCQEKVICFGNRRRQCVVCKRTWRIRKKKRGRKSSRASKDFVVRYLDKKIPPLYKLAQGKKHSSKDKLQRKLKKSLDLFLKNTPWPSVYPSEQLIAIADAMMISVNHKLYTFYFILLRPLDSQKAIITQPFIQQGTESWIGWQRAFLSLSPEIIKQICALVSDGHFGLISAAKRHSWIIQRCNFHLIARMQNRRSRWARSRNREEGEKLYSLLNCVLTNTSPTQVTKTLFGLTDLMRETKSLRIKRYLSGFIKYYDEYRSYLKYPHLNLPRTSNSAEVVVRIVRTLCSRAHGFRTITSLNLWVRAILKHKKSITCNGFHQPN